MRKRVSILFAIQAAVVCVFAFVVAMPSAPIARADTLPNGYSVTCTPNGATVICNISGCPRVKEDEAGDVVHIMANGRQLAELSKDCNNTTTYTFDRTKNGLGSSDAITVGVQGCRKHSAGSDDCGTWSDYHYNPPAPAAANPPAPPANELPVHCTGGPDAGKTLPPGSTCAAAAAAPTKCPTGSVTDTVPAGHECVPPRDAVSLAISRNGLNARVAITNNSGLPAKCNYTATKAGGLGPQEVDRSLDVGAHATSTITDMLFPPLGTTYNAVVTCTVTYDGKQLSIGQSSQTVTGN